MSQLNTLKSIAALPRAHASRDHKVGEDVLVGVLETGYGAERVTYALKPPGFVYGRVRRFPPQRLTPRGSTFYGQTPIILNFSNAALIHTFNSAPITNRPFVISAEMEFPRYLGNPSPWQLRFGRKIAASDKCKAILFMSDIARAQATQQFREAGFAECTQKFQLFRGAVPRSTAPWVEPVLAPNEPLRVLFVGGNGIHKGIVPLTMAARQARSRGLDVEITAVTSLDHPTSWLRDGVPNLSSIKQEIDEAPWVRLAPPQPNAAIRQLMREHHVFAMPSFDESLGWVFVEAAMEGRAAIATNVLAMPELVKHQETGWIVDLPIDGHKRWSMLQSEASTEGWLEANEILAPQITAVFDTIYEKPALLSEYGANALKFASAHYDPDQAAQSLADIYTRALE